VIILDKPNVLYAMAAFEKKETALYYGNIL